MFGQARPADSPGFGKKTSGSFGQALKPTENIFGKAPEPAPTSSLFG